MYNTIEQSLIFFPSYNYLLFYSGQNLQKEIILMIGALFILGRIVFLLGYEFIHLKLPFLRGLGFAMSLSSSIISIAYCFNFDIVKLLLK